MSCTQTDLDGALVHCESREMIRLTSIALANASQKLAWNAPILKELPHGCSGTLASEAQNLSEELRKAMLPPEAL